MVVIKTNLLLASEHTLNKTTEIILASLEIHRSHNTVKFSVPSLGQVVVNCSLLLGISSPELGLNLFSESFQEHSSLLGHLHLLNKSAYA